MLSLIASDNRTTATRLRHSLIQQGYDCPITNLVSLDSVTEVVSERNRPAEMIFLVLGDDRRLSEERLSQLRRNTSARIIAVGPANDPERILDAIHAGADDYLKEDGDIDREMAASLERLRARNHASPQETGRSIVVTPIAGGSGASFLAANLAVLLAQRNGRCALLDFDVRKGDQAALFDLKPRHTVADLCRNLGNLDQKMLEKSLVAHRSGVHLLGAPRKVDEIEHVSAEGLRRIVQLSKKSFPAVVVDLGDPWDLMGTGLPETAERVLAAFRLDFPSLRNLRRVFEHWEQKGVDSARIDLVVNRSGQSRELPVSRVEAALRRKVSHYIPDDPAQVNLSLNKGTPTILDAPRSAVAKSLAGLAASISGESPPGVMPRRIRRPFAALVSKVALWGREATPMLAHPSQQPAP